MCDHRPHKFELEVIAWTPLPYMKRPVLSL